MLRNKALSCFEKSWMKCKDLNPCYDLSTSVASFPKLRLKLLYICLELNYGGYFCFFVSVKRNPHHTFAGYESNNLSSGQIVSSIAGQLAKLGAIWYMCNAVNLSKFPMLHILPFRKALSVTYWHHRNTLWTWFALTLWIISIYHFDSL